MHAITPITRLRRWLLAALALGLFAIGWLGLFLPGLPTTIFWLGAVLTSAKACPAIQRWIYARGRAGRLVYLLAEHRALPAADKRLAAFGMTAAVGVSIVVVLATAAAPGWVAAAIAAAGLAGLLVVTFGIRTLGPARPDAPNFRPAESA